MRAILLAGLLLLNGLAAGQLLNASVASETDADPQWWPLPEEAEEDESS